MALSHHSGTFFFVALALVSIGQSSAFFTFIGNAPWTARTGAFAGVLQGTVVTGGGYSNGAYLSDVWTSNNGGVNWTQTSTNFGSQWGFGPYTVIQFNSSVPPALIIAGYVNSGVIWKTTDGTIFNILNSTTPFARQEGGVAAAASGIGKTTQSLYYFGGAVVTTNPNGFTNKNDVYSSTDGVSWNFINLAPWAPRNGMGVTVVDGNSRIVIAGGQPFYSGSQFNDVWISDVGATSWIQLPLSAPFAGGRAIPAIINVEETIYLAGGASGSTPLGDVWTSIDSAQSFQFVANDTFGSFYVDSVVALGHRLVLFGGQNFNGDAWSNAVYVAFAQ